MTFLAKMFYKKLDEFEKPISNYSLNYEEQFENNFIEDDENLNFEENLLNLYYYL